MHKGASQLQLTRYPRGCDEKGMDSWEWWSWWAGGATWCELLGVWLQAAAAVGAGKDDRAIRRVVVKEMGA